MGLLVDGQWQDQWYDTKSTGGRFVRQETSQRAGMREATSEAGARDYALDFESSVTAPQLRRSD